MGNASSTVTAGIKAQVNSASNAMYQLGDVTANGILADIAREACKSGKTEELDAAILEKVTPFLYSGGRGEMIPLDKVLAQRHGERTGGSLAPSPLKKFVCWNLTMRGAVGETLLHVCFLSGLPKHMKLLAFRLLHIFPKIINDFYINDEYYGETVLHMGIVSEDPEIVRFLLKCGADVNARHVCSGNFFTCDDQKSSRQDVVTEEHSILTKKTSYPGHLYWGEYPLSFAACLSQEECFRMLVAHGADLNTRDSNGNTVLHICTIHENHIMFDVALSLGAHIHIQNRQHLTPLTLAAFLAKKSMMEHIVQEERVVDWTYGKVRQALYPLEHIDTIDPNNGKINRNSALALAVYGESDAHLLLLPDLLDKLVHKKWKTFGEKNLYKQLFFFVLYFLCIMVCFMLRPTPFERNEINNDLICLLELGQINWAQLSAKTYIYHILNVISVASAAGYLLQMHKHINNVGRTMYILSLSGFPAKAIFLLSCALMVCNFFLRLFCFDEAEDIIWVVIVLLTAIKFLFFCRGFKSVGPFVLMLYKIILRDLIRFLLIYFVIVIGFSQGFYIIFLGYKRNHPRDERKESIMSSIPESYVRMFIMSLTEFATFFEQLEETELTVLGKIMFVIYMLLVTLLLINMLIASMTNTYQQISGNSLEWIRQWAAIVLMMEQSFDRKTRLSYQSEYSTPMEDGKRIALLLKTRMEEREYCKLREDWDRERSRFRKDLRAKTLTSKVGATPSLHFFTSRNIPCISSRYPANGSTINGVFSNSKNV